jgi:hypothetical protein
MKPLPVDHPDDVAALVDLLERPESDTRGLGDHFAYLAGVRPEWFQPYQELVITRLLDRLDVGFAEQCVLLAGASDGCVEHLAWRLRQNWSFTDAWALAAIGTDAALTAVAEDVRAGTDPMEYQDLGVWVPATGPAQYRFTPYRRAVRLHSASSLDEIAVADHPVGLPLSSVVRDPRTSPVTWHYLSLRIADIPGLPAWPAERLHLVGVPAGCLWTITANIDGLGRYDQATVAFDEPPVVGEQESFRSQAAIGGGLGAVDLVPYDADLVYCNGHIQLSPGVVGTAGGPPLGLYPNPCCRACTRLMVHVATVENRVREYGYGWRSVFLCPDCLVVSCTASPWN